MKRNIAIFIIIYLILNAANIQAAYTSYPASYGGSVLCYANGYSRTTPEAACQLKASIMGQTYQSAVYTYASSFNALCKVTGGDVGNVQCTSSLTCPYGGTVSGTNCTNLPACGTGLIRDADGQCRASGAITPTPCFQTISGAVQSGYWNPDTNQCVYPTCAAGATCVLTGCDTGQYFCSVTNVCIAQTATCVSPQSTTCVNGINPSTGNCQTVPGTGGTGGAPGAANPGTSGTPGSTSGGGSGGAGGAGGGAGSPGTGTSGGGGGSGGAGGQGGQGGIGGVGGAGGQGGQGVGGAGGSGGAGGAGGEATTCTDCNKEATQLGIKSLLEKNPGLQSKNKSDLYTPTDKTYSSVLESFQTSVSETPLISSVRGFFVFDVSGACPVWQLPSVMGLPSITLDMWCSSAMQEIWPGIQAIMIATASFIAFRIAVY